MIGLALCRGDVIPKEVAVNHYFNKVGKYSFEVNSVLDSDGNIDSDKLAKAQRELCLEIMSSENSPSAAEKAQYFNFFMNASGLRAKELSSFGIEPSVVSSWRSGATEIPRSSWELIREVFRRFYCP